MKQFVMGVLLGSILTSGLSLAGTFYDSKGKPNAPTGSIQQPDYFRARQQFLDVNHLRQQADRDRLNQMTKPCAK